MSVLDEVGISRTAVHEAGHAVAALYYQCPVYKVTRIPAGIDGLKSRGNIEYNGYEKTPFIKSVIHVSGEIAVAHFGEEPNFYQDGSKDYADIKGFYKESNGDPENFGRFFNSVIEHAGYIFKNPVSMALTILLAENTERKGELDADDIDFAVQYVKGLDYIELRNIFHKSL